MIENPLADAFHTFARAEHAAGRLDRRTLLAVLAGAIAAPALGLPGAARAQAKTFVLATFGGEGLPRALKEVVAAPFADANGVTWQEDPSGPLAGRIRAMVEAGQPIWDVCDSISFTAIALGKAGLLEPIDYAVVDRSAIREDSVLEHGVNYGWYSVVPVWDKGAVSTPLTGWADLFDVERFPGKRGFWKYGYCWEAALLADGVAPADLYPLDIDRAVAKFATIRDNAIFVDNVADALRAGEIQMGAEFSHTAGRASADMGDRLGVSWAQGLRGPTTFVVPRGNPAGRDLAMRFIARAVQPDVQAEIAKRAFLGAANPAVFAALDPAAQAWDPRNPAWADSQVAWNDAYYAENEEMLIGEFLDRVAGG